MFLLPACCNCQLPSKHTRLVIKAHLIEYKVYCECGGIMVWSQRGLLIWLIPNYKGQVKMSLQTHRQKGFMQAFTWNPLMWPPAESGRMTHRSSCSTKKSNSSVSSPAFSSRIGAEKRRKRCRSPASSCPTALVTYRLHLICLVVSAFAVASYVNSECGVIMVRLEQGLLVRFVPHHKVQGSGTLMREDMLISGLRGNHWNGCDRWSFANIKIQLVYMSHVSFLTVSLNSWLCPTIFSRFCSSLMSHQLPKFLLINSHLIDY